VKARRAATSVALLVLAAGSLLYAYGVDRDRVSDADRVARAGRVFPRFEAAEVSDVAIEHGADRIVLERRRSGDAGGPAWTLGSPEVEAADPAAVDALLEDMNVAARLRDTSIGPAAAGLGSPRVRATIRMGHLTYTVSVGAPAPVPEGAAYMSLGPGSPAPFVADRLLVEDLLRGADAYRDRILVSFGAPDTARIEVVDRSADGGSVVLTRAGQGFRLADGVRASRAAVERLFEGLAEARADSFLPASDGGPGVSGDGLAIELLASSSQRRVALRFGGPCPGKTEDVVVEAEGPPPRVACVSRDAPDALRAAETSLVDEGLFHARLDEVAELRLAPLAGPGPALDLARRGAGWHERAPADRELAGRDADAASSFGERLLGLRATRVRPGADAAPFVAGSKITVVRVDGAIETVQVASSRPGGTVEVRRDDDGATLVFPGEAARDLEARSLSR
jgi:hypothetical protein